MLLLLYRTIKFVEACFNCQVKIVSVTASTRCTVQVSMISCPGQTGPVDGRMTSSVRVFILHARIINNIYPLYYLQQLTAAHKFVKKKVQIQRSRAEIHFSFSFVD